MWSLLDKYLFATAYKDTKKIIHFQIISVVSSFNDVVLPFIAVKRRISADDSGMDADKNGFMIRWKEVHFCFNSITTPLSSSPNVDATSFNLTSSKAMSNSSVCDLNYASIILFVGKFDHLYQFFNLFFRKLFLADEELQ